MGTALAVTPDLPNRWRAGLEATERLRPVTWSDKTLASAANMAQVRHQMRRITRGKEATGGTRPVHALVCEQRTQRHSLRGYGRGWRRGHDGAPAPWLRGPHIIGYLSAANYERSLSRSRGPCGWRTGGRLEPSRVAGRQASCGPGAHPEVCFGQSLPGESQAGTVRP